MNRRIRIALPSKGRLQAPSLNIIKKAGISLPEDTRSYIVESLNKNFEFIFARAFDIPVYVHYGAADLGMTGYDIILEREVEVYDLLDLGFGSCRLVVAGPEGLDINSIKNSPKIPRVATEFPNLTRKYFEGLGKQVEILTVSGTVELAPRLGLADLIVDITETGKTLRENRLAIIDTILESSCRLICNRISYRSFEEEINQIVEKIKEAIQSK
ncbi:MAG: ATP phosphoribosyltransferase [Candidatus Bathyarchaeia archaeon]